MYHSLSLDTSSMEDSSFFAELEEGYHDSFYDEFDEDLIVGSLPMVASERFSYLENVYGISDNSEVEEIQGGDVIEDIDNTEFEDDTEMDITEVTEDMEETLERLSQEMENEQDLAQVRKEFTEMNSQQRVSLCRTNSGRDATVIMEGQDENEKVGLLQYACGKEEFRRLQSYKVPPVLTAAPTFKLDKFGNFVVVQASPAKEKAAPDMFCPPNRVTRAATDHGNAFGRTRRGSKQAGHVEVQKGRRTSNAVKFEEQTRFACTEPIQRQITKHSNAHKRARFGDDVCKNRACKVQRQATKHSKAVPARAIRFAVSDQNQPKKIQREATKHYSAVSRQCRFDSSAKTCGGEAIQRQVTKHVAVLC